MVKWTYAMVVQVELFSVGTPIEGRTSRMEFKETGWALVNDSSLQLHRMRGGERGYGNFQYPIEYDSHQEKMILELNSMIQERNEMRALKTRKNEPEWMNKIESLQSNYTKKLEQFRLTLSKRVKEAMPKVVRLYVPHDGEVNRNPMSLINKAAEIGWETTGQVPGFPGPTGITMMRLRTD